MRILPREKRLNVHCEVTFYKSGLGNQAMEPPAVPTLSAGDIV